MALFFVGGVCDPTRSEIGPNLSLEIYFVVLEFFVPFFSQFGRPVFFAVSFLVICFTPSSDRWKGFLRSPCMVHIPSRGKVVSDGPRIGLVRDFLLGFPQRETFENS